MGLLENISHVYKGLLSRNRAYASFREKGELDVIKEDLIHTVDKTETILDPMSGCGGTMRYFANYGYSTMNIELNPPAHYWQVLTNPNNFKFYQNCIQTLKDSINHLPSIDDNISIEDDLFSCKAKDLLRYLFQFISSVCNNNEYSKAILLPFVSRFANYQRNSSNITHFKVGGLCSYSGWEVDFLEYLDILQSIIEKNNPLNPFLRHQNVLSDIFEYKTEVKYSCLVSSPPYPNYRDYSKLFKIENFVLDEIINNDRSDFSKMIASNIVSGKQHGVIDSISANSFLTKLLDKSTKLSKKAKYDIEVYYHPYFSQYFYSIQEAYKKINTLLKASATCYIVVNDNITRDIAIPVSASICDIFNSLDYEYSILNKSQISHYGNIAKSAKRINSYHTRSILKIWKK